VNVFLKGGFCFVLFCFVPLRPLVLLSEVVVNEKRGAWEEAYHERREVTSWETEDFGVGRIF
jgi:hypothetical protein